MTHMTATKFLEILFQVCMCDKRFDEIEEADILGSNTLRIYPFDGSPLIITIHEDK